MSNEQYSPWASGDGFGTPRPQPARSEEPPTREQPTTAYYTNPVPQPHDPTEPSGWSQPQQFGALAPQPQYPSPSAAYSFGQRLPYGGPGELPEHPLYDEIAPGAAGTSTTVAAGADATDGS